MASNRPDILPYWATEDEVDSVYGTNNKEQPSSTKQEYGQQGNKNTLRQDINYLFNKIREWLQFFDEQFAVGDVYIKEGWDNLEADISDQLGGTWEFIDGTDGEDTIAGVNVQVFRKISESDS